MNKTAKDIITSFYQTDPIVHLEKFLDFLHPQVKLEWHSSFGLRTLDYTGIKDTFSTMKNSFISLDAEIKEVIAESDKVVVRYTYLGRTIERPDKEDEMGYFMVIWQMKDNKLFKGHQISQQSSKS